MFSTINLSSLHCFRETNILNCFILYSKFTMYQNITEIQIKNTTQVEIQSWIFKDFRNFLYVIDLQDLKI